MPFLDPATIAKVESLALRSRVVVQDALTGMHRARLHGSSVEFAEHKEYSPGDEIKHIDWKAYAKVDRYYVKQFEQESQLTAYLILDGSASMAYAGTGDAPGKLDHAAHLLAALGYLLIRQRDKVALLGFGDETLDMAYVPPRGRLNHYNAVLEVLVQLCETGARGTETAAAALDRIGELTRRRRSLIVLASDLFEPDNKALPLLHQLRAQGHDVALMHILHPDEIEFPFERLTTFESLEDSSRKLLVNATAVRKQYLDRMNSFCAAARTACVEGGVDYHFVPTSKPPDETVLEFLTQRSGSGSPRSWSS